MAKIESSAGTATVEPEQAGPAIARAEPVDEAPKKYRIVIDEQENWDKNQRVYVTDPSTGKPYLIQRGHEVVVPVGVLNNLNESVIIKTERDENGNEVEKHIKRFAVRVVGEVRE